MLWACNLARVVYGNTAAIILLQQKLFLQTRYILDIICVFTITSSNIEPPSQIA